MINHRLFLLSIILLYGSNICIAQQEDTLKFKPPFIKPELQLPKQPELTTVPLSSGKLSLDGLDYISSTLPDTSEIVPDLSVENFIKYYYDDFIEWEEDNYGWNFELHPLTHKNGKYLTSSKYIPRKRGDTEKPLEAPYPLANLRSLSVNPDMMLLGVSYSITINWKPTKHDIWYKENFSWEKRIMYNGVSIKKFGYRDITEFQRVELANSIIEKRKSELGGAYNPDLSKLRSRIRKLKEDIKNTDQHLFRVKIDSIP